MKNNGLKALLFAAAAALVAVFIGYLSGALDSFLGRTPTEVAQPQATAPATETSSPADEAENEATAPDSNQTAQAGAEVQAPVDAAVGEQASSPQTETSETTVPTFDVLRVEGDGSAVVAGKAVPGSTVELFDGTSVLGKAVAGSDGAFAIVLDDPLKSGDHQIVLRATEGDKTVSTSVQTAVVSVPDKPDGQVLAMVEEPGMPAQLLTVPQAASAPGQPASSDATAEAQPAGEAGERASAQQSAAGTSGDDQPNAQEEAVQPTGVPRIVVEAVEIDGAKVFVAGRADAGRKVRIYANEILLGEALTSPDGHFLVEASRDLPVGEYTIRVDGLDSADSDKVVVRASVPFQREPGETISAVAPSETGQGGAQTDQSSAPKLEHADGSVIIRRGDTLWQISRRIYGHGTRYSTIYLANQQQISDPNRIWPGQVFKLPQETDSGEKADFDALGDRVTVPAGN